MTKIYIYTLSDPRDDSVRYVGQTANPHRRYLEHSTTKQSKIKALWIKQLGTEGLRPIMKIVETTDSEHGDDAEGYWIEKFKSDGHDLLNTCRRNVKMINTGIYLSASRFASLSLRASSLNVSRNRYIRMLIDSIDDKMIERMKVIASAELPKEKAALTPPV